MNWYICGDLEWLVTTVLGKAEEPLTCHVRSIIGAVSYLCLWSPPLASKLKQTLLHWMSSFGPQAGKPQAWGLFMHVIKNVINTVIFFREKTD